MITTIPKSFMAKIKSDDPEIKDRYFDTNKITILYGDYSCEIYADINSLKYRIDNIFKTDFSDDTPLRTGSLV